MSSKLRRIKRKVRLLVRMDDTRSRMLSSSFLDMMGGCSPDRRFWETCMMPLGQRIGQMGHAVRAIQALEAGRAFRISKGGRP